MKSAKLKYAIALLVVICSSSVRADVVMFGSGASQFSMEFVPIGNPGNAPDTVPSRPSGLVGYNYQMGKFEVSEDMVNKYNTNFGTANGLAITQGTHGPNKPATSISWNEAARFVNWLNISSGGLAAYKFTSSGVNDNIAPWTPADTLDYNAANPFRSLRAKYVLPSYDEWHKAAYYDPSSATYYIFPVGSNSFPTAVAGGTAANTAVYNQPFANGPADITNAGGLSPYGIMALGGNVMEWTETSEDRDNSNTSSRRTVGGGSWNSSSMLLYAGGYGFVPPTVEGETPAAIGFRVASLSVIPEPSSLFLVGIGTCAWSLARRRRAKNA